MGQPGHADAVALLPTGAPGAEPVDHADDFVTGRHPGAAWHQVTLSEVEIRPAHPAGPHADADFARSRLGDGPLHPDERMVLAVHRAGLIDDPGLHDLIHHRSSA